MKYILAVGIFFKKFRNSTKIKLFSNNLLIDEIILEEPLLGKEKAEIIHNYFHDIKELLELGPAPTGRGRQIFPEKVFVYEIDESVLGEKISFELNDSNSNYTNGFMTESNQIAIDNIILFPKKMFTKEKLSRTLEFMRKKHNLNDLDKIVSDTAVKEYQKNYIPWPCLDWNFHDSDKETIYKRREWLGGKKRFHVNVRKKFGFYFLWYGQNHSGPITKFGNPKTFIEYNYYYRLINIVNED